MAVIYLMPKCVIEMVNDDEEMPLRCDNTGKGAIELMTEEVIDIKEQITLFLELSTSVATVWDVWEPLSSLVKSAVARYLIARLSRLRSRLLRPRPLVQTRNDAAAILVTKVKHPAWQPAAFINRSSRRA